MKSVPRLSIASVILFYLFCSCSKQNTVLVGDHLLQRIVSTNSDTITYSTYQYDAQKRLVAIGDSDNDGYSTNMTIDYDSTGNPIKYNVTTLNPQNNVPYAIGSYLLVYQNGRVIQKLRSDNSSGSYYLSNTYSYDLNGRLLSDSGLEILNYYSYDDSDNIAQIQSINPNFRVDAYTWTTINTYNSNTNPLSDLGLTVYFANGNFDLLSKHNKIKSIIKNQFTSITQDFTYDYQNGLLKKMTMIWEYQVPQQTHTEDFYYY